MKTNVGVGSLFHAVSVLVVLSGICTVVKVIMNVNTALKRAMHYEKTVVRNYLPFPLHFCSLCIQGSRNKHSSYQYTLRVKHLNTN